MHLPLQSSTSQENNADILEFILSCWSAGYHFTGIKAWTGSTKTVASSKHWYEEYGCMGHMYVMYTMHHISRSLLVNAPLLETIEQTGMHLNHVKPPSSWTELQQ